MIPGQPLLSVRELSVRFGGITALSDISFDVNKGNITGLIGPNGAGKTTCFNCVTRFYEPAQGRILLNGTDVLRLAPHRIAGLGIARTFQNVALFDRMSVLENVLVGIHSRYRRTAAGVNSERAANAQALEILGHLGLAPLAGRPVRALPFGTRKMVELARALLARPELLLLDEPAAGLNSAEVESLGTLLVQIASDFQTTILMVEHHMRLVMAISNHIVVLVSGRKIADGVPTEIRQNPAVIEAYLGAA